jgi:probable rRNA maturation factor
MLLKKKEISSWIKKVVSLEGSNIDYINFIFCSDEYLHKTNLKHLNHDTYTDVITFDYSNDKKLLLSDIFISIERVQENAVQYNQTFMLELCTVMIHGILHLLGHTDETDADKSKMRQLEKKYTSLLSSHYQVI